MGKVRTALSVSVDGFIGSVGERAWADHDRVHSWVYDLKFFREAQGMGDDGVHGTLAGDQRLAGHHRLSAVRGHILEMAGRTDEARQAFASAASRTRSQPERIELLRRAARLS
jgi:hypothetical protein